MKIIVLDNNWTFRRGFFDSVALLESAPGEVVNLPHDGMIGTPVSKDAPAGSDSGYFNGGQTNYTKYVFFPKEWEKGCVGLKFDGVMQNATIEINGSKVALQHNGYAPFFVDLTNYALFEEENRISVQVNTSMQPNSRWYTGSGLYRGVQLLHGPKVHIVPDGIYMYTKEIADGYAFLEAQVEVENVTLDNRIVEVSLTLSSQETGDIAAETKGVIQLEPGKCGTARLILNVKNPLLWDADNPNLYIAKAVVKDTGIYRTHFIENEEVSVDEASTLFGIRTISADSIRGLLINGKCVKLKGGCIHHDNGLLGSVSLYETEARKVAKLKEIGFNAIRTAHNPPSSALVEACDRLGMYIFDEAFDAWSIAKRGGDYNQYFETDWEKDITAFVKRDRTHPSVIMWSTGNEIPERGGLANGYITANKIAAKVRMLDGTRLISNGICSYWSGLDDSLMKNQSNEQNSNDGPDSNIWEKGTEPFANGLDVFGYNYMEDFYEKNHEMFPERVVLGSENFPKEIGYRWPFIEDHPYVIGEFTWTAWDYIGEAGIGKAVYIDENDPTAPKSPWDLMPQYNSPFPWRTANDADYDITGHKLPQGAYRSVVWGNKETFLYSMHPDTFGKKELMSMWGFPAVLKNWNYAGYEDKKVELVVYSCAEEVEVLVNGESIGRKKICMDKPMPYSVRFETEYKPGKVEAVSFCDGKEISRDVLVTAEAPAEIRLTANKQEMKADGHDLIYVEIEILDANGNLVPDAELNLKAELTGDAVLAGFGSGNPITEDDYTDDMTASYRGRAMAILRSDYSKGEAQLVISSDTLKSETITFKIKM